MKHRSKKSVSLPTSSTSMPTAVSVTATPRDTTWRPGSRPTSQNVSAWVTRLNLGPTSGALHAARRVVRRPARTLLSEEVVERRVARGARDVVEHGQLGCGRRAGHRLDLAGPSSCSEVTPRSAKRRADTSTRPSSEPIAWL